MQLLYPAFLWAFLLLAIPIIIHLFRFRRYKTVFFSNVRFLKAVQQESTSRNRLKHLLVLACRLLALSALILAFAQPFLAGNQQQVAGSKNYISVFIDNSFTMNRLSNNFSLLDKAKQTATELVKSFDEQDRFQLLTNNFGGNENRLLNKDEMLAAIDEVAFSSATKNLETIAKRQNEVLSMEGSNEKTAFVLSDFQSTMVNKYTFQDSSFNLNLIPFETATLENIGIDTCFFAEPFQIVGKTVTLFVKVENYGSEDAANIPLSFTLNGQTKSSLEINIAAGSSAIDTLVFIPEKAGWNEANISITDEPVTFDNNFYLSFNADAKLNVLSISEGSNKFIHAVFGKNEQFALEESSPNISIQDASRYSLVVVSNLKNISSELSAWLSNYISSGGSVIVFPAFDADKNSYNKFLLSNNALQIDGFSEEQTQVSNINLAQNIFRDVFEKTPENMRFPQVNKYAIFSHALAANKEDILKTKEDNLLMARFTNGAGNLYVSAVSADAQNSELPSSAIFAPMLFKMAVLSNATSAMEFTIGSNAAFSVATTNTKETFYRLKNQQTEFIPQQFLTNNSTSIIPGESLKTAGFYNVVLPGSDSATAILAANYNRAESDMKFLSASDLKTQFENNANVHVLSGSFLASGKNIAEAVHSKPLWKYFLAAALAFLLLETLLLRFWKTDQFAKAA